MDSVNIAVLIKQTPAAEELRFDERGNLMRDGAPAELNPLDEFALEAALKLKDEAPGSTVTVLTMGPPQAEQALRHCLSKGADAAVLATDPAFKGGDTLATARVLAAAVRNLSGQAPVNLVLCGRRSSDSDTGQVPAQTAALLGWPDLSCALSLSAEEEKLLVTRALGSAVQTATLALPAVVSIEKNANEPRLPSVKGKLKARSAAIRSLSAADLGLPPGLTGAAGSPTRVARCFAPPPTSKKDTAIAGGSAREKAASLAGILKERGLL